MKCAAWYFEPWTVEQAAETRKSVELELCMVLRNAVLQALAELSHGLCDAAIAAALCRFVANAVDHVGAAKLALPKPAQLADAARGPIICEYSINKCMVLG